MAKSATGTDSFARGLLAAVMQAIRTALQPMCGDTPVTSRLRSPDQDDNIWISAGIPFSGSPPRDLTLLLPEKSACGLTQAFVGFEIPADSPDMNDAVGELVNILAGHVIERLEAIGHTTKMTLPVVARGDKIEVHPAGFSSEIFLNCQTPPGELWIRLAIAAEAAAAAVN